MCDHDPCLTLFTHPGELIPLPRNHVREVNHAPGLRVKVKGSYDGHRSKLRGWGGRFIGFLYVTQIWNEVLGYFPFIPGRHVTFTRRTRGYVTYLFRPSDRGFFDRLRFFFFFIVSLQQVF